MKKTTILWLLFSLMGIIALPASAQCTAENNAFSAGEDLSYKLYFNWKFIWVTVGTANMSIKNTSHQGQEAYRCHLITKCNKLANKLFVPLYYATPWSVLSMTSWFLFTTVKEHWKATATQ